MGSTFAHCSQLQQLSLSQNLRIIEQKKPFTKLQEVHFPPSLTLLACFCRLRSFEQFVNKRKAKHCEVHMPGSVPLTDASNWTSPNGSDSCRQMSMTNGETTSKQPHAKLASSNDSGKGLLFCCLNFESWVQESSG